MRQLILFLIFALPLIAAEELVLKSGDTYSYDPPNSSPWTTLDARSFDMAVDFTNWDCTGSTSTGMWRMGADLYIGCGATTTSLYLRDGSRFWEVTNIAARGVVLLRASRAITAVIPEITYPFNWLEIWDADGSGYTTTMLKGTPERLSVKDDSGVMNMGGTGIIGEILWVKQYSTVIQPGPSSPLPGTRGTGDLGDWHFDGSVLTDGSGLAMTLSESGTAFATTATINPAPDLDAGEDNFVDAPTVRAGASVALTGSCATYHTTAGCTCVWSDQGGGSGPTALLFTGSTTSCSTTAVPPTFGSYTLRLVVTDAGSNAGTTDFDIGAVAQDSTAHVVYPTDNIDLIVGPQLAFPNTQWPWFAERRQIIGNHMGAAIPDPATMNSNTTDWGQAGVGTIAVHNVTTPTLIIGTGTDFQTDYCGGGTSSTSTWGVIVIDAAGLKWRMRVASCDSATQITSSDSWNRSPESGLSYLKAVDYGDWSASGSEAQNFYDNGLAYGAMYYATGLSKWLTWHNDLETWWWDSPQVNHGQCELGPTGGSQCATANTGMESITGLMLWAEVNSTQATLWPDLEEFVFFHWDDWGERDLPSTDIRPSGYALAWGALEAALDPDATRATASEVKIDAMLADLFSTDQQHPDGAWEHYSNNAIVGTGAVTVTNGSTTVTCDDTCNFLDGTHTGNYFLAYSTTLDILSRANGRRDQILIASVESSTSLTLASNYTGATTSGLSWRYAPLSMRIMQPFIQAMPMAGFSWLQESGYYDGRQETIDTFNYNRTRGYRSHAGGYYSVLDDGGCQADITADTTNSAFDCQFTNNAGTTDFSSIRYVMQEPMRGSAWAAKYARDLSDPNETALATHVDVMFGHMFGKWGGPQSDYDNATCSTCYGKELDDGQTTFTQGTPPAKNKNWGFGFGFGGAYVWDALRSGDPSVESLVSYSVPIDIGSVGSATKASVTLYEPKGTVSRVVNDATGSTVAVTGDSRQGSHLAKIEYKDVAEAVLHIEYAMVAADGAATQVAGSLSILGAVSHEN